MIKEKIKTVKDLTKMRSTVKEFSAIIGALETELRCQTELLNNIYELLKERQR